MTNLIPLRPFWIRSSLLLGWIAGGAFALLGGLSISSPPPPPVVSVVEPVAMQATPVETPAVSEDRDEMSHDQMVSLSLDITASNPSCMYYSAFDVGEVELPKGTRGATLEREFDFMDGCHWRSEETLVKVGEGVYSYSYREKPISCKKGSHAASPCTRSGTAVVNVDEE